MPYLIDEGYSRGDLGLAMSAIAIAYGLSKFLMGLVSDRSNPRYFLPFGLLVSAGVMFIFGFAPWATSSVTMMFILLFINGWAQGMGWPPSGRTMVHWWSQKERGGVVSVWNVAHNVGGGLIGPLFLIGMGLFNDWHAAFYVPAAVALGVAVFAFITMRDTPQSVGLPPIEKYKNDYPEGYDASHEDEFSAKEIFVKYVLRNKMLWYIALANVFVYLLRYGVLDWAPTYLKSQALRRRQDLVGLFLLRVGGHSGHAAVRLDVGQDLPWQPWPDRHGVHGARDRGDAGVLAEPGRQPDRGHDRAVLDRFSDLRPGDADRSAGAGTGTEESRRHGSRLHRSVRLSGRFGRGECGDGLHR
jgi:sugar phosphate permease